MRISRPVIGALIGIAVVAIPVALVVGRGLAADEPPTRLETAIARRLVWLSIPVGDRRARNPLAGGENWREGAEHFDDHCAACHGSDGRGHTAIGRAMYPPVPDLSDAAIQDLSDGALFSIIQHGVRWTGMPAFRRTHSAEDTWRLVAFIRQLPRAGRSGVSTEAAETPAETTGVTVAIDGTAFHPADVTVRVGDAIAWKNDDPFPHNVVSTDGGWRSGDLDPQHRWQWKATTPGTFRYVCTLHPGMSGVVHVR